jgi:hypothetical protein
LSLSGPRAVVDRDLANDIPRELNSQSEDLSSRSTSLSCLSA